MDAPAEMPRPHLRWPRGLRKLEFQRVNPATASSMKPTTAEELAHRVQDLQLASPAQLDGVWSELGGHHAAIETFGATLVRRELLTSYQLDRLLRGERGGFFYGSAMVLYQVGAGSFARVYRAVNPDDGRVLAVKVLRTRYSSDPEKCKGFRREGEMGRLLRHPNIVAIEDVGQQNGASYITMEFVEGQTLRELVRIRGAVDVRRGIDLILQLVSGLEYAHRRGVTHRDLKASNVLISTSGQAKLVDFGLAGVDADSGDRALGRLEQPRTIDYAALEKLAGMKDDSVRSDIYFLGTIAYLMLSGKPALKETRERSERSDPRRFTSVEPLATQAPQVPRDLVDLVTRMMDLDPLERWQTAADVHRALEPLAAKYSAEGSEASATGPSRRETDTAAASAPQARPAQQTKATLMIVETSQTAQESLRTFFTKLGYRVLMTENPQRALARFSSIPPPADCLVISAQSLGEDAVAAFNTLSTDPYFAAVPAILLAGEHQQDVLDAAKIDERRRIVSSPVRTTDVQQILGEIVVQK